MKKKGLTYFIFFTFVICYCFHDSLFLFAEEEIVFGFCDEPNILKVLVFISSLVTMIKILVPVILIVMGIKKFTEALALNDDKKIYKVKKDFIIKIIIGLSIFLVPTFIGVLLNYSINFDRTKLKLSTCGTCFFSTTNCIKLSNEAQKKYTEKLNSEAESYEKMRKASAEAANEALKKAYEEFTTPTVLPVSNYYAGGYSYGLGCTSFVSSNTYDEGLAKAILENGKKKIGTKYSEMDCSKFTKYTYSGYIKGFSAASQAKELRAKCVPLNDLKPGDVFFTSNYNTNGKCSKCINSSLGNRCSRWNCILHTGVISKVEDGKITQILHSSAGGVKTKNGSGYTFNGASSSGKSWYVMVVRPYA